MNAFSIIYKVNDASAQSAAKRQLKNILDIEKGWLSVAKAQESAYAKGTMHVNGFTKAAVEGSAKRTKAAADETQKIDVGYYKVAMEGIKHQDRLTAAANKAAKERQAFADKEATKASEAARKSANDRLKLAEDEVKFRQAQFDKAATKEHDRALKEAQDQQKLAEKMVAERKKAADSLEQQKVKALGANAKAEEKNAAERKKAADSLEQQKVKALANNAKAEEKNLAERKRAADSLEQQKVKALDANSKLEDKYLQKEYNNRVKYEKAKEKLSDGPLARQAQQNRRLLSETEVFGAAKNRVMDRFNKDRIDAEMKAMGTERDMFKESIFQATGMESAFSKVGVAMMAWSAGKSILDGIIDGVKKARDESVRLGQELFKNLKTLRALASVEGKTSSTGFAAEKAKDAVAMGMTLSETADFEEAFHGGAMIVGPGAADEESKHLTDADYKEFMLKAGRLGASKGMSGTLSGEMASSIVKSEDFKKTGGAKTALGRLKAAMDILDAGRGRLNKLAPEAAKLRAMLASEDELEGVFDTTGESEVALSTASEFDSEEATSTQVARAAKSMRDFGNKKKAKFFKRTGITAKDSFFEAQAKLNKVLEEEVAKGIPVDKALIDMGVSGRSETMPLRGFFNARNRTTKRQLARLAEATTPEGIAKGEAAFEATKGMDTMKHSDLEARSAEAEAKEALKEKNLELARELGRAKLREEGHLSDPRRGVREFFAGAATGFTVEGEKALEEERGLAEMRKMAGLPGDMPGIGKGLMGMTFGSPMDTSHRMRQLEADRLAKAMEKLAVVIEKGADAKAKADPAPIPAPLPGPPVGAGPGR